MRSSKGRDIRERTFHFGVQIVKMANGLPRNVAGFELAKQIIRSGTGIGANVEEADAAESKNDFVHKMSIALKEAQETRYWIRMITESELSSSQVMQSLFMESDELVRVINAIIKNTLKG